MTTYEKIYHDIEISVDKFRETCRATYACNNIFSVTYQILLLSGTEKKKLITPHFSIIIKKLFTLKTGFSVFTVVCYP